MSSFQALRSSKSARQRSRIAPSQDQDAVMTIPASEAGPSAVTADVPDRLERSDLEIVEGYDLPPGLSCRRSEKRGRGVYTEIRLIAGSRLLTSTPTVSVLSTLHLSSYCSACKLAPNELTILSSKGEAMKALRRCVACRLVYYCSAECQKADWTSHQAECAAHKRLRSIFTEKYATGSEDRRWIMGEAIRALGRLCWARKRDRRGSRDPEWWRAVEDMESHRPRMDEKALMELANTVQHLRQYLSAADGTGVEEGVAANMEDYGFKSSSELLDLVSAFKVNSFTLSSPSLSPIGVAMSPTVALFNHSCEPNAVVVFSKGGGRGMEVIAIRNIEPGEEILTSYVDVSLPGLDRQKDLKQRYGFECDCQLCHREVDDQWIDPRWCIRHPTCGKNGKAKMPDLERVLGGYQATCDTCGQDYKVDMKKLKGLVDKGRQLLAEDEAGSLEQGRALKSLSELLPPLLQYLPTSSHPLLALLRLHSLLLTPPKSPTEQTMSIASLAKAYGGAELVHPPNHPTLAIILAEWGKLLAMETEQASKQEMAKRLYEAVVVLRKAFGLAEKGFGPGGGIVGMEVDGLIRGCQGELGLLRSA